MKLPIKELPYFKGLKAELHLLFYNVNYSYNSKGNQNVYEEHCKNVYLTIDKHLSECICDYIDKVKKQQKEIEFDNFFEKRKSTATLRSSLTSSECDNKGEYSKIKEEFLNLIEDSRDLEFSENFSQTQLFLNFYEEI